MQRDAIKSVLVGLLMATDSQIAALSAAMKDDKLACLYLIPTALDLQSVQLYHYGYTTGDIFALLKHQDSTRVLEEFTLVPAVQSNFADCLLKAKVSSYKVNGKGTGNKEMLNLSSNDLFKVKIILNSISARIETQHLAGTPSHPRNW